MANPWFRLYSRIVTDPIIEFMSFEDQRHFVWLLCLKNDGVLDKDYPADGMIDRVVAKKLGLRGEAFGGAKERLMASGLVDAQWQPVSWDDLQFKSDSSKERTRKYRAKLAKSEPKGAKPSRERHNGVTVTAQETDTEQIQNRTDKKNNVELVFNHWQKVLNHPKARLDANRIGRISKALDNYSVDDLKLAVDGCKKSEYHMGKNDDGKVYDSIDLIYRNAENIERFIGYNQIKGKTAIADKDFGDGVPTGGDLSWAQ